MRGTTVLRLLSFVKVKSQQLSAIVKFCKGRESQVVGSTKMSDHLVIAMITSENESARPIRWTVRRRGRSVEAEVLAVNGLWRFRLVSTGDVILQRRFRSLSSARRYWQTIRDALAHDGWR